VIVYFLFLLSRQQLERLPRRSAAGSLQDGGVNKPGGQSAGQGNAAAAAAAAQQAHAAQAAAVMDLVSNVTGSRSSHRGAGSNRGGSTVQDSPYLLAR